MLRCLWDRQDHFLGGDWVPWDRHALGGRRIIGEEGQDIVEYALLLPLFLLLVLGIVELSLVIWSYDTISNAAREGVRVGIIRANTEEDMLDAVLDRAVALNLAPDNVTITREEPEQGAEVKVEIDYDYNFLITLIGGGHSSLHLHTAALMHME